MSSTIVITLAVIGGMAWLGFMLVAALRRRGREEVPSNLAPGTTDDELETRRLEGAQKTAVILSAFLAVSLPLYFLGEQARQDSFTGQFHDESVARGEALVTQYQCFSACHGPEGVGGAAPYVEKRSGISVLWTAPSLNDVFYRYSEDEVTFWVTYGRGNTPMPAWGLAGGGPLNESQVQDVVNYLKTIQVSQEESVAKFENQYRAEQAKRLENATQTAEEALVKQQQVLADINAAPDKAPIVSDFATRARSLLDNAGQGIDTDGDGLSDTTETGLVDLGNELVDTLRVMDPVTLDPQNPTSVDGVDDLTTATSALDRLDELVTSGQEPILVTQRDAVAQALDQGVVDPVIGLSPAAIDTLSTIADQASSLGVAPPRGDLDLSSATTFVQALEDAASAQGASADLQQAASDARAALDGGQDADGDGLSADAEKTISDQVQAAIAATTPSQVTVPNIDPTNPETSGEPDADVASNVVAGYENLALNLTVTTNNLDKQVTGAQKGVDFLQNALDQKRWQIDFQGVADSAFNGDVDKATRAVLLFNSYCARCHTAGFSAGVPYTLEAGSGGFGPALWKGREPIQFGPPADKPADDLLIQFITKGSEEQKPYGLNGFGSGRMPAFGEILTESDIELLAQYLRGGNLDGMG
ncbi:MAG: c-type cytochrome, partial [Acidimicrobiia bacterium]